MSRLLFTLALVLCSCSFEPPADRPDVLMITLCALRADRMSTYGFRLATTPNLDRVAARGAVFEQAIANAPWTRPSVASMVTGLYPRSTGLSAGITVNSALDPSFVTLAEYAREAGYHTIAVNANPNARANIGFDQGYAEFHDPRRLWNRTNRANKMSAEDVTSLAAGALRSAPETKPYLAHLLFVDVHQPYSRDVPEWDDFPSDALYVRNLRHADGVIGAFLEALAEEGRYPDVILVNADHGEGFETHHSDDSGHGRHLFNSALHVPFILYAPDHGVQPRRIAGRVELVDTLPTLLEVMGIDVTGPIRPEGRSVMGAARGGDVPDRPFTVAETHYKGYDGGAVISDAYKFMSLSKPNEESYRERVFDRVNDPGERKALDRREHEALYAELGETLVAWQAAHPGRASGPNLEAPLEEADRLLLEELGYLEKKE